MSNKGESITVADILSQNEIDELIKSLNEEENPTTVHTASEHKRIRGYDFRRPSKFAKDHLKTLSIIHESYARIVTNFLSGYLRTLIQVEATSVEPVAYYEFSNSIPNPTALAIVDFAPLSGSILLQFEPSVVFALVDRILGGKGETVGEYRNFTEIELAIIEKLIGQLIGLMKEPWENVINIVPRLEKIETNAQYAQIISPNEIVALVTLTTKVGDVEGTVNLCIPHMVIEPILPKLSTKLWFSHSEKEVPGEVVKALETKIQATSVPIKVILGKADITVEEFSGLQAGDVIQLTTGVTDDLEVMVGDLLKFNAKPGVKRNRTAVRITEVLRGEEG